MKHQKTKTVPLLSQSVWFLVTDGGGLLMLGNPNTAWEYHVANFDEPLNGGRPFYRHRKDAELLRVMREWNRQTKPKSKHTDHTMRVHPVKATFGLVMQDTDKKADRKPLTPRQRVKVMQKALKSLPVTA